MSNQNMYENKSDDEVINQVLEDVIVCNYEVMTYQEIQVVLGVLRRRGVDVEKRLGQDIYSQIEMLDTK